ncbi:zinc-finger homeodomain protein 2-like [Actinidia eriantha]|uniref:zinc-finger homeodomain protein 2-like n=1 Tax=Actinidia eriantha TaxID=165200 RepID=UPI00258F02E2|nr:zinc-finger homeodomain protein 2-like [Actinidia eriantha]
MANNNENARRCATIVSYRECQRNFTSRRGQVGHACPEFVVAGEDLLCATCGCHRNYHRKEEVAVEVEPGIDQVLRQMASAAPLPQLLILAPHIPLAPPPEDDIPGDGEIEQESEPRKRDRARLTPAQREMMRVYAGRLGWSLQGHNEEELLRFCSDIGIIPQVFKVWMNNNRRKYANTGETSAAAGGRS